MYWMISARSTNAESTGYIENEDRNKDNVVDGPMALGRLLVAIIRTFFLCLSLSSCVSNALTTCVSYISSVRWRY